MAAETTPRNLVSRNYSKGQDSRKRSRCRGNYLSFPIILIPNSCTSTVVEDNWFNVVNCMKVFTCPIVRLEQLVSGITGVKASSLPLPDQIFGFNRLCLVKDGSNICLFDVAFLLSQFFKFLFEAAWTSLVSCSNRDTGELNVNRELTWTF